MRQVDEGRLPRIQLEPEHLQKSKDAQRVMRAVAARETNKRGAPSSFDTFVDLEGRDP